MRSYLIIALSALAGCGESTVTVEGTLAEPGAATEAWAVGSATRAGVADGAFALEAENADTLELRFTLSDGEEARMRLEGVPAGETVRLDRIWFADGLAFTRQVEGGEDGPLTVNGLRLAGEVPADVNVAGTVLAISDDGDAMIVRPTDLAIPDLNVAVTPASIVRTMDGDPVEADRLSFGDSLRVSGLAQGGYVVAAEIMVPRRTAVSKRGKDRDD